MNKKNNPKISDLALALKKNIIRRKKNKTKKTNVNKAVFGMFLMLFLSNCQKYIKSHGPQVDKFYINNIIPHKTTFNEVVEQIGAPTIVEDNQLIYINYQYTNKILFAPEIVRLDYLIITFNKSGEVIEVKKENISDLRKLNYDDTKVEFKLNKSSIWDQFTRNIGKYSTKAQKAAN